MQNKIMLSILQKLLQLVFLVIITIVHGLYGAPSRFSTMAPTEFNTMAPNAVHYNDAKHSQS